MAVLALVAREVSPSLTGVAWAGCAGISSAIGMVCFYQSLAVGKTSINASLTGLIATAVPVCVGTLTEQHPSMRQLIGIILGLASTAFVSRPGNGYRLAGGFRLSVVAGFSFGIYLILAKVAGESGLYWILAMIRATSFLVMLVCAFAIGSQRNGFGSQLKLSCLTGVLDGVANLCYVRATQCGRLYVAAALSSLYAAVTVALAFVVLKERVSCVQRVGIGFGLIAIALLAHA